MRNEQFFRQGLVGPTGQAKATVGGSDPKPARPFPIIQTPVVVMQRDPRPVNLETLFVAAVGLAGISVAFKLATRQWNVPVAAVLLRPRCSFFSVGG